MESRQGDESARELGAQEGAEENENFMQKAKTNQDANEPDSETPLLVQTNGPNSKSQPTSPEVPDAVKAFPKLKNKSGLWSLAAKSSSPQQQQKDLPEVDDLPQQQTERLPQQQRPSVPAQQRVASSVESPVPSITVTEPSFDTQDKGEVQDRRVRTDEDMGRTQSSIYFSSQVSEASTYAPIEICVYMMDNKGTSLTIAGGRVASADILLDLVLEEARIPREFKPCFAIWLSSPLLHVQLRPNHVPYAMAKNWGNLLTKYTLANADQLSTDEPILRLQRNVFLSPSADQKVTHHQARRLLFCEAKENIREGLYPIDVDNCFKMAGICAAAQFGSFVEGDHPREFYKPYIHSFLPDWIENSRAAMMGCSGTSIIARLFSRLDKVRNKLSYELQQAHKTESERLGEVGSKEETKAYAQSQYLARCYELPFYGCAFFRAMLYKPPTFFSIIWNIDRGYVPNTFPIKLAISPRGIFLLDLSTADHLPGSVIMSIPFSDLYWSLAELKDPEDEPGLMNSTSAAVLPCLFLHFPHPERQSQTEGKEVQGNSKGDSQDGSQDASQSGEKNNVMLQIVTKQAVLIDAFMRSIALLNSSRLVETPTPGASEVSIEKLYGSGVRFSSLTNVNLDEEEEVLRQPHDGDECLTSQFDRVKLVKASDFDQ